MRLDWIGLDWIGSEFRLASFGIALRWRLELELELEFRIDGFRLGWIVFG